MASSPAAVATAFLAAFARRDVDGAVALVAEDAVWQVDGAVAVPSTGLLRGPDRIREWINCFPSAFRSQGFRSEPPVEHGPEALIHGWFAYTILTTGRQVESDFTMRFTVHNGLIHRYQIYEDSLALALAFEADLSVSRIRLNGTVYTYDETSDGPLVLELPQGRTLSFAIPPLPADTVAHDLALLIRERGWAPVRLRSHGPGTAVTSALRTHHPALCSPPELDAVLRPKIMGFIVSQAIFAVTKLGVVEALRAAPATAHSLATRTGTDADALARFLRLLATEGLLTEDRDGVFALTDLGALLAPDGSLHHLATHLSDEVYRAWSAATHSLRTGKPAFDEVFGDSWFGWLANRPAESEAFNATQAALVTQRAHALLSRDWSDVNTVVDIGGGNGTLITALLRANPHLQGTLFDQPQVVAQASFPPDTAPRCTAVPGDFFTSPLPPAQDRYLISQILHDWPDEAAGRILSNIREAMRPNARLLILDQVLPDTTTQPHPGRLLDLNMLILLGGRERSTSDWTSLLTTSGFTLTHITPGPRSSLIEATPTL